MRKFILFLCFISYLSAFSQTLPLPTRSPQALNGTQIVAKLTPLGLTAREDTIFSQIISGNVPDFLRNLVPVHDTVVISSVTYYVTYFVAPDFFALGCDSDYFLCPMTPLLAQRVADYLGFSLPTRKMSDIIWKNATVKMAPESISPSAQMITVPVFADHDSMVWVQRKTFFPQHPLGELVAGDKKDVILSNHIYGNPAPGRVVIYGWHYQNGTPIQPLYYGHEETYADYSHGIRMVQNEMLVNGCMKTVQEILMSSTLNTLLSDEGSIAIPHYLVTPPTVTTPQSFCVLNNGNNQIVIKVKADTTVSGYHVSLSTDGKCFPIPERFLGNNIVLDNLETDTIYYVKIATVGKNGGVSTYSEVLGANTNSNNLSPHYLVINGFDRATTSNTYDYIIQHGQSLQHIHRSFSSATNEAWTDSLVNTNDYSAVDFILGEESTANETFSDTEQQFLEHCQVPYFVSGSEIGWDLDHLGSTIDQTFYHQYMYANYVEDAPNNQASTYYNAVFEIPSLVSLGFSFDNGTHGTYNVGYPDVVNSIQPASTLGYYTGFPAKYMGTYVWHKMVYMALPFETVYPSNIRDSLFYWVDVVLLGNTQVNAVANNDDIIIYPNPTSGKFQVSSSKNQIQSIEIYNMLGENIYCLPITDYRSPITINVSEFPAGMYLLKVNKENSSVTKRFSVVK